MAAPGLAKAGGVSSGFPSALDLARVVPVTKIMNKTGNPLEADAGTPKEGGLEACRGYLGPVAIEEWHD